MLISENIITKISYQKLETKEKLNKYYNINNIRLSHQYKA